MDVSTPRQIGKSAMQGAPVGLGCGIMSRMEVSNAQAMPTVKSAWDTGVRFYDTSAWYGVGRSERRLRLALLGQSRAKRCNSGLEVCDDATIEQRQALAQHPATLRQLAKQ